MAGINKGFNANFNSQQWIATEGQTVFTIVNSKYTPNKNQIEVYVNGIRQHTGDHYTESSSTSFTLSEGLPNGTIVEARWLDNSFPSFAVGHSTSHKAGGVDELNIKDLAGYKGLAQTSIDVINLKEYGADATGQVPCDDLILKIVNAGKTVYVPDGTFLLSSAVLTFTSDLYMQGNGAKSIIKCKTLKPRKNVNVDGVHFISSCVNNGDPTNGGIWDYIFMCGDADGPYNSAPYQDELRITNSILEFATDSQNVLAVFAHYYNRFHFEHNRVYTGGIQVDNIRSSRVLNNYHDMHWANINEVYHFNVNDYDILVDGNTVYNTATDFIDLYANGTHATISNNYVQGILAQISEVKIMYRDVGAMLSSSVELGTETNVLFEHNRFVDIRWPWPIAVRAYDQRTTPINDYTQLYSHNIQFVDNYFDFAYGETSTSTPWYYHTIIPFLISGTVSPWFERNKIKSSAFNPFAMFGFMEDSQITLYPVMKDNEVIVNEFTGRTPDVTLIFCKDKSAITKGKAIGNRILASKAHWLRNESINTIEVEFDGNIAPMLNTSLFTTLTDFTGHQIHSPSGTGTTNLTFRNMDIYNVDLENAQANMMFKNCKFTGATNIFSASAIGNEYLFDNCEFASSVKATFGGGLIYVLSIKNSLFRGISSMLKGTAQGITRYYEENNSAPYLISSSAWDSTSTIIPTRSRDSALFSQTKTVISDSFNRTNNSASLGATDTGQTWTTLLGNFGIYNNLAGTDGTGVCRAVINSGLPNCSIEVTFAVTGLAQRLVFRVVDSNNEWFVSSDTTVYSLYKRVSNVATVVSTINKVPANGDRIRVDLNNNIIQVYINGVLVTTVNDSFNSTATQHGIYVTNNASIRFDDFKISGW